MARRRTATAVGLAALVLIALAWTARPDAAEQARARRPVGVPKSTPDTPFKLMTFDVAGTDHVGMVLGTRVVDLHPMTVIQNARTSGGGVVQNVPSQAISVGPLETWRAEKVSIWHAGAHDNPFGMRLTTYMISQQIIDTAVPMSLLGDHPNVQFNFLRSGIGRCGAEMH